MAYLFLPWHVDVVVKFLLVSTLSLAVTLALYEGLIRRFNISRFVRRYYRCPAVGTDPLGYLEFMLQHLTRERYDVLLPVHEQQVRLSMRVASLTCLFPKRECQSHPAVTS